MTRPRVLLVDDDASIRRFVALALDELEVELVEADGVPQARQRLAEGRYALVITDLMMPGETGLDLLQHLADHPEQRGDARLAVFSAGLNAAMQARLAGFDVWRQLSKPIALTELEQCVRDAIGAAPAPAAPATAASDDGLDPAEQATVQRHFAGDRGLFLAYRASCIAQFAADVQHGDAALARGDAAALRRLGHSLKSVLLTLGQPEASATARRLEDAGARADLEGARESWSALRAHLASQR